MYNRAHQREGKDRADDGLPLARLHAHGHCGAEAEVGVHEEEGHGDEGDGVEGGERPRHQRLVAQGHLGDDRLGGVHVVALAAAGLGAGLELSRAAATNSAIRDALVHQSRDHCAAGGREGQDPEGLDDILVDAEERRGLLAGRQRVELFPKELVQRVSGDAEPAVDERVHCGHVAVVQSPDDDVGESRDVGLERTRSADVQERPEADLHLLHGNRVLAVLHSAGRAVDEALRRLERLGHLQLIEHGLVHEGTHPHGDVVQVQSQADVLDELRLAWEGQAQLELGVHRQAFEAHVHAQVRVVRPDGQAEPLAAGDSVHGKVPELEGHIRVLVQHTVELGDVEDVDHPVGPKLEALGDEGLDDLHGRVPAPVQRGLQCLHIEEGPWRQHHRTDQHRRHLEIGRAFLGDDLAQAVAERLVEKAADHAGEHVARQGAREHDDRRVAAERDRDHLQVRRAFGQGHIAQGDRQFRRHHARRGLDAYRRVDA
mmetsp:Transcript_12135/g.34774  ORF Transcript_12135/g.34774 Transcript_12135/m.34774 type:complete len:486 (-) Transcript_12135:493-1950(-)